MISTILLSIGILGLATALLALRILVIRGGEFPGTCASSDAILSSEDAGCGACARKDRQECEYRAPELEDLWAHRFWKSR